MSHAVVLHVNLPPMEPEEGMRMLNEQVVPAATALQGFQKGTWIDTGENKGMAVVVFDTEEKRPRRAKRRFNHRPVGRWSSPSMSIRWLLKPEETGRLTDLWS